MRFRCRASDYVASVMSRQLPVDLAARLAEQMVPDFARPNVENLDFASFQSDCDVAAFRLKELLDRLRNGSFPNGGSGTQANRRHAVAQL